MTKQGIRRSNSEVSLPTYYSAVSHVLVRTIEDRSSVDYPTK